MTKPTKFLPFLILSGLLCAPAAGFAATAKHHMTHLKPKAAAPLDETAKLNQQQLDQLKGK